MKNSIILSLFSCASLLTQALPMAIESRSNTPEIIDCSITRNQLKNLTQKPKTQEKWSLTKKIALGTASAAVLAATIYTIKNHEEIYNFIKNYFYKPTAAKETRLALYVPQPQKKHTLNAIKDILLNPKLYQLSCTTSKNSNNAHASAYYAIVNTLQPTITTDADGNTLLHKLVTFDKFPKSTGSFRYASISKFLEALEFSCKQLIKNGASIDTRNKDGFTPFDLLMQSIVKVGGDASGDVEKYFGSTFNFHAFGGQDLLEKIEKEHFNSSNHSWCLLEKIRTMLGGKEGEWVIS